MDFVSLHSVFPFPLQHPFIQGFKWEKIVFCVDELKPIDERLAFKIDEGLQ
jgi:hypothetical protein